MGPHRHTNTCVRVACVELTTGSGTRATQEGGRHTWGYKAQEGKARGLCKCWWDKNVRRGKAKKAYGVGRQQVGGKGGGGRTVCKGQARRCCRQKAWGWGWGGA